MNTEASRDTRVWDLAVRVFHWSLATAFAVSYLTEDELQTVHIYAGYLVGVLIAFRLLWGFVGPRHARFSDFVRTPSAVLAYLKAAVRMRAPRFLGHNPAGGTMVVALLITLAVTVVSGMALYGTTDFAGPLAGLFRGDAAADVLKEVHELAANLTLGLVVLHLAGVFFASLEHRENLVKAMITGRKEENPG
jgi:cytochrome b